MTQRKFIPMIEDGFRWIPLTEEPMTVHECNNFLKGKKGTFKLSRV